jgi:hypothetical protein
MQQQQTQFAVPRESHAGRNFAILLLLAIVFFVALPFVNIESVSIPYGVGSVNVSVNGSLSYAIFHCGEVHLSGTGTILGSNYASVDRYEWVCSNQIS